MIQFFSSLLISSAVLLVSSSGSVASASEKWLYNSFKDFRPATQWIKTNCRIRSIHDIVGQVSQSYRGGDYNLHIWCKFDSQGPVDDTWMVSLFPWAKATGQNWACMLTEGAAIPLGFFHSNEGSKNDLVIYLRKSNFRRVEECR